MQKVYSKVSMSEKSITTEPQVADEPVLEVPGIPAEILESFRAESQVGYQLFKSVIETNDQSGDPDRYEQLKVFLYLPKRFQEMLATHLVKSIERDRYFQEKKGVNRAITHTFVPTNQGGVLAGEFFEELVRTENKMKELESESEEGKKEVFKKLRMARELMRVWQYPEQYGIGTHWRNADAAFFEIEDDGTIVIKAVGEVKATDLDLRAYKQLQRDGIEQQLGEVISFLKAQDKQWFIDRKLPHLSEAIAHLHVSSDFKIRLIVPRNRNISEDGITEQQAEQLVKHRGGKVLGDARLGQVSVEEFTHLLTRSGRISLQKSLFSQKELGAMTNLLFGYLDT